jgi:hypothetical protein
MSKSVEFRINSGMLIGIGSALASSKGMSSKTAQQAHHRLLHDVPKLDDVTVHVSPSSDDGQDHHALTAHHRRVPAAAPTEVSGRR